MPRRNPAAVNPGTEASVSAASPQVRVHRGGCIPVGRLQRWLCPLRWAAVLVVPAALVLPTATAAGQQQRQTETLAEAFRDGSASVDLRYRYEWVADDTFAVEANASTLRTALAYETGSYKGFGLFVEAENVSSVGNDLYHNIGAGDLGNGRIHLPVVADPELTQINQAGLRFAKGATTVRLGRQEILLDDHRFIGNVGWRQNHQSFDAFRIESSDLAHTTLNYAFIGRVLDVRGGFTPVSVHALNAAVAVHPAVQLVGYAYAIDYEHDRTRSTTTFGFEISNNPAHGNGRLLYEVEYASQRGSRGNPRPIEAGYVHLMTGREIRGVTVVAGWERLGGSPERGQFNTPLATLHPFNGWADRFLVTPAGGLEDAYVSVRGATDELRWSATYHAFRADTGGARYGDEIDVEFRYLAPWQQTFAVGAALYDADAHAADVRKVAVWTSIRF